MGKRWTPELLTNYSPVIKPMPPLEIETICDEPLACMTFSAAFIPYLLGLIEIYRWEYSFSGSEEDKLKSAGLFRDLMEKIAMSDDCCCGDTRIKVEVLTRVTIDGKIQVSIDGGDTWVNKPDAPSIITPTYPPYIETVAGVNKCDVADNVYQELRRITVGYIEFYRTVSTFKDFLIGVVQILAEAIAVILEAPEAVLELIPLIIEWAKHQYTVSPDDLEALFTDEYWAAVRCIIYCRTPDDGTYEETDFLNLLADCSTLPGGDGAATAGESTKGFFKFWQAKGMNTIAALGTSTGSDCSDCACGCNVTNWVVTAGTLVSNDGTTIIVDSVQIDGSWVVEIRAPNSSVCCHFFQPLSGIGASMSYQWNERGERYAETFPEALNHTGLWPTVVGENAILCFGAGTNPIGQVTFIAENECE